MVKVIIGCNMQVGWGGYVYGGYLVAESMPHRSLSHWLFHPRSRGSDAMGAKSYLVPDQKKRIVARP